MINRVCTSAEQANGKFLVGTALVLVCVFVVVPPPGPSPERACWKGASAPFGGGGGGGGHTFRKTVILEIHYSVLLMWKWLFDMRPISSRI